MKKILLFAAAGLIVASCSSGDGSVTIQLPADFSDSTLIVNHMTVDNMFAAQSQDELNVIYDTIVVKDGVARLSLDPAGPSRYNIQAPMPTMSEPEFYGAPGEKLEVTIKSFEPLDYKVTGSALMEDVSAFNSVTNPIKMEYVTLVRTNDNVTQEQVAEIMDRYDAAIKKFIADNPKSQAVPYAATNLSVDDFKAVYDEMTPEAKKSMLMPFADAYNTRVEEMQKEREAEEARQAEIASGKIVAPGFTLPDINGKNVSLSDFKGKWVVLDFWGSWCGWCVKGFPALKDAYAKYGNKIVVIGIDCNETEEDWRAGVKKYELPWINLYNGDNRELYSEYNIQGFPTKAIVNPEGKLVDLTTGEDPEFFTRLAGFVE
ncbi:MAG: TlpA family protein disulfide reductase [Duncaniella sp.]|nr:TlpA family protein disulfide reductase [Duncaniella sp.]